MKPVFKKLAMGLGVVGAMMVTGCSDDNPWDNVDGSGTMRVSLATDVNVTDVTAKTRAGSEELEAPATSDFAITVEKSDGSYSNTWASADLFPTDKGFSVGEYTVTAKYGDIDDEGFGKPCFIGATNVTIKPDLTSEATITATLANTMVSLEYTDKFKSYFSSWSAVLQSSTNNRNAILQNETEPIFIAPGQTELSLSFTKQNGQGATIQPATFTAKPRCHYHIVLDVNVEFGTENLTIQFFDDLVQEEVEINLSDDLMNLPAPTVTAEGFTSGSTLEVLQGTKYTATPPAFFVYAQGGFESAELSVVSSTFTLPVGENNKVNLVGLDASSQATLKALGLDVIGLYNKPDQMARVNLAGLIPNLPAGTHKFQLVVKDKLTRINDPVEELTIEVSPVSLEIVSVSNYQMEATTASFTIAYNGTNPAEEIKYQYLDINGQYKDATVKSIAAVAAAPRKKSATRAYAAQNYAVTLNVPAVRRDVQIRVVRTGVDDKEFTLPCVYPSYDFEIDAFATYAVIQVTAADEATKQNVAEKLRVFVTGASNPTISRDSSEGIVTVSNLPAGTLCTFQTTLDTSSSPAADRLKSKQATTETIIDVPNGDFEELTAKLTISGQLQGGQFKRTYLASVTGQNTQGFSLSEPTGWATTNAKTYNESSSNGNSWFRTLSVYNTGLNFVSTVATVAGLGGQTSTPDIYSVTAHKGSNAMALRNVAYSESGTTPSTYTWTAATASSYYNPTVPTISNRAAGKLFLGSYSYATGGTETYNHGVSFASRPTSFSFWYKYTLGPVSGEKGTVTIKLMNGTTVVASATQKLPAVNGYTQVTIPLNYDTFGLKATQLRIMFTSSDQDEIKTTNHAELFLQESYGAVLWVDNLSFTY